jgi:hypothetical protein
MPPVATIAAARPMAERPFIENAFSLTSGMGTACGLPNGDCNKELGISLGGLRATEREIQCQLAAAFGY